MSTTVVMTPRRKIFLTIAIVVAGLLAVATWSESRDGAFFATMSLDHARRLDAKEGVHLRQFSEAVDAVRASERLITYYSVGVLTLCFAGVVAMWMPRREVGSDEELNQPPA